MIVTKQQLIEHGLEFLRGAGTEAICRVCIPNGGSCCKSCRFLIDREGCQARNTSCTAWLCGFQQYVLFQLGLLDQWRNFWNAVPGQDYRQDSTPHTVNIERWLEIPDTQEISAAFALDLEELRMRGQLNMSQFNDKLFNYMDKLIIYEDTEIIRHLLKKIKTHMKDFRHFKIHLDNYFS